MVMERCRWDTSQLIFKNVQNYVCGTAVSWDFTKLGVPSDAEKVVDHLIESKGDILSVACNIYITELV